MANPPITDTSLNKKAKFITKHDRDTTAWQGTIQATAITADTAALFGDLKAYNEGVRRTDPTVPTDLSQLHFFLMKLDNIIQSTTPTASVVAFATEWIMDNTLVFPDQLSKITIYVTEASTAQHGDILTVLKAAGYTAVLGPIVAL